MWTKGPTTISCAAFRGPSEARSPYLKILHRTEPQGAHVNVRTATTGTLLASALALGIPMVGASASAPQFDATKNHVDQYGSNIIFQFQTVSGKRYLTVNAYIVNDAFWLKHSFYRSGAIQNWQKFASNLNAA